MVLVFIPMSGDLVIQCIETWIKSAGDLIEFHVSQRPGLA